MDIKKLFTLKYENVCLKCGCETKVACVLAKDFDKANERLYKGDFLCKNCMIIKLSSLYILTPCKVAEDGSTIC